MTHVLFLVFAAIGCIVIGAIGHAFLAKEAGATKSELSTFAARLRAAFDADIQTARTEVNKVAAEIEKKL